MIETIIPKNGIKEHIIVTATEGGAVLDVATACGHNGFHRTTGEVTQYESYEEIEEVVLCMNCKKRYEKDE